MSNGGYNGGGTVIHPGKGGWFGKPKHTTALTAKAKAKRIAELTAAIRRLKPLGEPHRIEVETAEAELLRLFGFGLKKTPKITSSTKTKLRGRKDTKR